MKDPAPTIRANPLDRACVGDFSLWARVSEVAPGVYEATATAIALTNNAGEPPPELTGRFDSRDAAFDSCPELVERMRSTLAARGDRVISVDIDHAPPVWR